MLELERAAAAPPGLLVHGLGGMGKTTLARGYIEWLADTDGLPERVLWHPSLICAASNLCSIGWWHTCSAPTRWRAGSAEVARPDAGPARPRLLIVWDNFESASGRRAGLDGAMAGKTGKASSSSSTSCAVARPRS